VPRLLAILIVILIVVAPTGGQGQPQGGQLDASPALFTVLCAINAAGYDAELDSPSTHPLRIAIREEIAHRNPSTIPEIRALMARHRQEDANWDLRLYIGYGLLVDGPPRFKFRVPAYQLPPDIAALEEFGPILEKFYQEAGIEELWRRSQPAIEQVLERYHDGIAKGVTEVNAYLRNPPGVVYMGKRFQVFVDLLGAPNQIHVRNFLDDYYVVLTHSLSPNFDEVRRAYMHYLLDPLATKYAKELDEKKALGDYALGAPYLADHYKSDFLLLATRSLIRAIEARLAHQSKQQSMVNDAMGEGFILAAHFYEQLPEYEKQEQAMRLYFPELVKSIDLAKEERRMANFEYPQERPKTRVIRVQQAPAPPLTGTAKLLEEAENLYRARDLEKAREVFLKAAGDSTDRALQAKAHFGLARIAALNNDPDLAEQLFEKTLALGPEPADKAWTLVYLGRLSLAAGDPAKAQEHFHAALAIKDATPGAREAAQNGIKIVTQKKD
jgi:predicted negative regulator of RcsB-dependent stress response